MFCDVPASIEPTTNTTMANWNSGLRPYRSPTLPYSGVEIVEASRYDVTTHER
jgi:hypothetical protein